MNENLDFATAQERLAAGNCVAREAWNGNAVGFITPADIAATDWKVVEVGADGQFHDPDPDISPDGPGKKD